MKKNYKPIDLQPGNHIFGKERTLGGAHALQVIESAICEGLAGWEQSAPPANVFGRSVSARSAPQLSFLHGLSGTGLRTAGLLNASELMRQAAQLQAIAREQLPVVLHVVKTPGTATPPTPDWLEWVAADPQEAIDLAVALHRTTEAALVPGILWLEFDPEAEMLVSFPEADELRTWAGDADALIDSPTPAQEILFGARRRRIPNWYNPDTPSYRGIPKDALASVREQLARKRFFTDQLREITARELRNLSDWTGREYTPCSGYAHERADHLVIAQGVTANRAVEAVDVLQLQSKARVGCLQLTCRNPFPTPLLAQWIKGKKSVTVLEPIGQAPELRDRLEAMAPSVGRKMPNIYSGQYGRPPQTETIVDVFENALGGKEARASFVLEVDMIPGGTAPAHEVLAQQLQRLYPGIQEETLGSRDRKDETTEPNSLPLPLAVRQYRDKGPGYSRLSQFRHNTVRFYREKSEDHLPADPLQSLSQAPAVSAGLAGQNVERLWIPQLRTEACTGCGECLVACPYNALPSLALPPEGLIRAGIKIGSERGLSMAPLTPLVNNLAKLTQQALAKDKDGTAQAPELLSAAFEQLADRMKMSEEKRKEAAAALDQLIEVLADFPLFNAKHVTAATQALFGLTIDPHACTGCAACVDECPEEALFLTDAEDEVIEELQTRFSLWEQLPDTPGPTIGELEKSRDMHPFAPQMLSRNFYHSMYGAGREQQPEVRRLHHLITATVESVWQPRLAQELNALDELVKKLSQHIHDALGDTLPTDDFSLIARALNDSQHPRLPLDELMDRFEPEAHLELLDAEALKRKIELLDQLKELNHLIRTGPTGVGRARYGMILAGDESPYRYPFNPFVAPVVQVQHDQLDHLDGYLQGHIRHLLDNVRLLRRAYLEIEGNYQPERHDALIAGLRWDQLTPEERQLVPPLLLIGTWEQLGAADLQRLYALLEEDLPVAIFLLADPWATPDATGRVDAWSVMLSGTGAHVFQSTTEAPDQFFRCLRESLSDDRPVLGLIHTHEQPGALRSRAFPVFRYDPRQEGYHLSHRLDLSDNPSPNSDWDGSYHLAHWLSTLPTWQEHFLPLPPDRTGTPVEEYLTMSPQAREGIIPVIETEDGETLALSSRVLDVAEQVQRQWTHLRSLAGTTTAFPERLKQQVEAELEQRYERELSALKNEYEKQLKDQRDALMQEVKVQLRDKLLTLARRRNDEPEP